MYLHLGQGVIVPTDGIVGVFDLDNATTSKHTRTFLERAQNAGVIVEIGDELPRSFVVYWRDGQERVYLSQISARTLLSRVAANDHLIANNE